MSAERDRARGVIVARAFTDYPTESFQEMGKLLVKVAVGGFLIGAATVALAVSR